MLLYGGTFDPVHHGHLAIARAARDALRVPVHFMPASDPPHRAPPGADASRRAAMLALAIADEPDFHIDLRELRRDGPSYSVDTLRALRAELGPAAPVALLIGADSLLGLPSWHAWRELFDLAHFVVADRPGSGLDLALPAALAEATEKRWTQDAGMLRVRAAGCLLRLRQPLHGASATQVRAGIAADGGWRELVPAGVADYIVRHRLYGVHGAGTPSPL
ncbi:nicotinate-nucleotide adenylyltransferase [Luteimonas sp. SDU101]|uniref:nicotinate-nucleotide adenylyltransferase n=1 Tax=unclassified Luteimonas TaxID=2629088 RepID=UPI003EB6FFDC